MLPILKWLSWKKNIFSVPYGSAGKPFVSELSKHYRAYAEGSALECIAIKAVTVMLLLLLQKPCPNSKPRDHRVCLERRLKTWSEDDLNDLVLEGRTLQNRLGKREFMKKDEENITRSLMCKGNKVLPYNCFPNQEKVASYMQTINDSYSQTVLEVLTSKHPQAQPASTEAIQVNDSEVPQVHPVVFDRIHARCIRSAALNTKGAAGPSGIDAHNWRRLCTSFKSASHDLCHSLALLMRRLCTTLSTQNASLPCCLVA